MRGTGRKFLEPGRVLRLTLNFPQGSKPKYLILVDIEDHEDGYCRFLLINSAPAPFIQAKPYLLEQQLAVTRADMKWLHHDSCVCCHELRELPTDEVIAAIEEDPNGATRPVIGRTLAQKILAITENSVTLAEVDKVLIRNGLGALGD